MLFDVSAHPVVASGAYMVKIARVRVSQEQPVIIGALHGACGERKGVSKHNYKVWYGTVSDGTQLSELWAVPGLLSIWLLESVGPLCRGS